MSSQLASLLPAPQFPPLPPASAGNALLPFDERVELAAAFCLASWLVRKVSVTPRDVMDGVPEFAAVYKTANALGTLLGRGVRGKGLGLRKEGDSFRASYANAWLCIDKLKAMPERLERVSSKLGFADLAALATAIRELPGAPA